MVSALKRYDLALFVIYAIIVGKKEIFLHVVFRRMKRENDIDLEIIKLIHLFSIFRIGIFLALFTVKTIP